MFLIFRSAEVHKIRIRITITATDVRIVTAETAAADRRAEAVRAEIVRGRTRVSKDRVEHRRRIPKEKEKARAKENSRSSAEINSTD